MTRYIEADEATEYLSLYYTSDSEWFSSSDQEIYLNRATAALNRLPWQGVAGDTENFFPRLDEEDVPEAIKKACAELAFRYAEGVDPSAEFDNLVVTSQKIGSVSITSNNKVMKTHIIAGIVSLEAWYLILPYLINQNALIVERG